MKFCSHCGASPLVFRVPEGDTLPRFVCAACGEIHYQNPKIVVGCLPEWEGRVLLCKRAIEPRHGLWTLPAGFLENGETVVAGAERETLEEARARVDIGELYTLISLPQINQVYMVFRARLKDLDFGPGPESLEVRLFDETRNPVGAARVPHDRPYVAQLVPRPQARLVSAARVVARTPPAPAAEPAGRGLMTLGTIGVARPSGRSGIRVKAVH